MFLLKRLREQSTWRGLVGLATFFGAALSPDQIEKIAAAGLAVYLVIETFLPSQIKEEVKPQPLPVPEPSPVNNTEELKAAWNGKTPGQFP